MGQLHFEGGELIFEAGELAMHDDCCCGGTSPGCLSSWTFTDKGFIDGGQDGAVREYSSPGSVSNSPWSFASSGGLTGLRCDFEDSDDVPPAYAGTKPPTTGDNCANYNAYTQTATATGTLTLASNGYIAITWDGVGEVQDAEFELMQVKLDGVQIGFAHAPGGDLGCTAGAAVVAVPPSGTSYPVTAGTHTVEVTVTTNDQFYHVGSYYQFVIDCAASAGGGDCQVNADFTATSTGDCIWDLAADTAVDPNCVWDWVVDGTGGLWGGSATGCNYTLDLTDCPERIELCDCGDITVHVTLTVGSDKCTQTLECNACGNPIPTIGVPIPTDCEDPLPIAPECATCAVEFQITWPETDDCDNELGCAYIAWCEEPFVLENPGYPCDHPLWPHPWSAAASEGVFGGEHFANIQLTSCEGFCEASEFPNLCVMAFCYRIDNPCCIGPVVCEHWSVTEPCDCDELECC
jgi:hypothetical protein